MAKREYEVEVTRTLTITETKLFVIKSTKKLTEEEVLEQAHEIAESDQGAGWEEQNRDSGIEDSSIVSGEEDLKEE
jgi:hypothetical protein